MLFSPATLRFFRGLARHNDKSWFEAHRADYDQEVSVPMHALIEDMDVRFATFAPEITGDPKRSMLRIYRDIRFSRDKSPYKTHAACWFRHRDANARLGGTGEGSGAGFYFHLAPGASFVGGGIWMPPRPLINRLRSAIAEKTTGFERVVEDRGFVRAYGGLADEAVLKRMPRGFPDSHPAARWLKYQSFTAGTQLTDGQVTSPRLASLLETHFKRLLPLVRWLNIAFGLPVARHR